ncbi:hypothetical protein EDD21DRAFT_391616, partial [Dissophora ornata]
MDIQIVIEDDTLRGIATSMLLAIIGILFFIIIQSAREGITIWLYKHFPKNKAKLYVMATSRRGSYLDVLGVFNILGGFPLFIVLLVMTFGVLGNIFSGLVVSTKNVPMDLCTNNGCFSTGIGNNMLEGYDNVTTIIPIAPITLTTMRDFALQDMNNTITAKLPWSGTSMRRALAAIVPPEIHRVPLERLKRRVEYTGVVEDITFETVGMGVEYINGTSLLLSPGTSLEWNNSAVLNWTGWNMYDGPPIHMIDNKTMESKAMYLSTSTAVGINLLLISSVFDGFGDPAFIEEAYKHITTNDTLSYIKKAFYYGVFSHLSVVGTMDVTFQPRNYGPGNQLELSTLDNIKVVKAADMDEVFNATLDNLKSNQKVLSNYSREMQNFFKDIYQDTSSSNLMDFSSYVTTCLVMAISQTRPVGMIKGYEQANVITPIISIKLSLLVPLLLVTVTFFIPYAIVTALLHNNDSKWMLYK